MKEVIALIPARGGSKGLTRKNLMLLEGEPLIVHSIRFALACPSITKVVVSTEDSEIAEIARIAGAEVPFIRPTNLSQDNSPMAEVIRHAVNSIEISDEQNSCVALLEPTSPLRSQSSLETAIRMLDVESEVEGIISISKPFFNPLWVGVEFAPNEMLSPIKFASREFTSRQEVPDYWRINGQFFLWRMNVARKIMPNYLTSGKYKAVITPEFSAIDIDSLEEFEFLEVLLKSKIVEFDY